MLVDLDLIRAWQGRSEVAIAFGETGEGISENIHEFGLNNNRFGFIMRLWRLARASGVRGRWKKFVLQKPNKLRLLLTLDQSKFLLNAPQPERSRNPRRKSLVTIILWTKNYNGFPFTSERSESLSNEQWNVSMLSWSKVVNDKKV